MQAVRIACYALAMAALMTTAHADPQVPPSRVAAIEQMLPSQPQGIGPRIEDRPSWQKLAALDGYKKLIKTADRIAAEDIPDQPDSLFLLFSQKGDRASWEKIAFKRRGNFTTLVLAECLTNTGKYLPKIQDYVRALCDEKTWVMSAHDGKLLNFHGKIIEIDLGASTLGWEMATTAWWLGDKLDPDTRSLIRDNLQHRIIDPAMSCYEGKQKPFWWMAGTNNWNTVCWAGTTGAALATLPDRHTRAIFAAAAEFYTNYYFKGISPDGYCSEGMGYWDYGFGHYVMLAETLRQATGGKLDLLERPDARQLARFGARMQIINNIAPAFADSQVYPKPDPNLMYYVNRRYQLGLTGYDAPAAQPLGDLNSEAIYHFPNAATDAPLPKEAPVELRSWFDKTGILIARPAPASSCRMGVALKGGNNNENHNHNDVGSYVVVIGDKCLILDPGAERYTARTFSSHRYDSNLLNSFGHDVPMVAGKLQRTGAEARAKIIKADFSDTTDTLALDITTAYPVAELQKLERTWTYSRQGPGSLTTTDHATFKSPQSFGTALITLGKWSQTDPTRLLIEDGKEKCEVAIEASGPVDIEPFTIKEDSPITPTRIGINLHDKTADATITLRIKPVSTP